ncbi:hypothetical protein MGN70_001431 [Eutypa lata]|nr:hypothetical protein MGN70_001431 [Eutypa lata]
MSNGNNDDGGSFEDSSFSSFQSNPWPYISPSQQRQLQSRYFEDGATIHFERLRGLPFWSPIFMFRDKVRVALVVQKVVSAAQNTRRRLTAEEIDAASEHADNAARQLSWAHPVTVAAAVGAAANGRRTFKFPFFQPKMQSFDPYYFPTRGSAVLKGAKAAASWHFIRALAYTPLTWFASIIFFSSVADMSFQAHMLRDPRLTTMVKDIQSTAKAAQNETRQGQRRQLGLPDPSGAPQPSPSDSEVSPISQTHTYSQSQAAGNTTASAPQQPQWGASQAPAQKPGESTPSSSPSGNASWDSDPFEDDASPVAPSARRTEQSSSSGSSWIRLRQQSQSEASSFAKGDSSGRERGWAQLRQDKAPNTTEGSRGTEQYSYSQQDEEKERRNYEKEQAQKEFDALLEAERRGDSSPKGRR